MSLLALTQEDLDEICRTTDWSAELAAAVARYDATPRWRFIRRHVHAQAIESCLWFVAAQEAGRL